MYNSGNVRIAMVSPPVENHFSVNRIMTCDFIDILDSMPDDMAVYDLILYRKDGSLTVLYPGLSPFSIQTGTAAVQIIIMFDLINALIAERGNTGRMASVFKVLGQGGEFEYVMGPASSEQYFKLNHILCGVDRAAIVLFRDRDFAVDDALATDLLKKAKQIMGVSAGVGNTQSTNLAVITVPLEERRMFNSTLTKLVPSYSVFTSRKSHQRE